MRPNDAFKWNKRASIIYAFGAWTVFGSLIYYKYSHKEDPFELGMLKPFIQTTLITQPNALVASEPVEEQDKPNVKKYETAHNKTVLVYKENFVPYSTRLFNFLTGSKPPAAPKESETLKSD